MAEACIIGLAAFKGNVNRQTIAQVIGLLNGIDIQTERMKQTLISVRNTPTPSYEEILAAKTNAVLQLDSRSAAIETRQRQLADQQRDLQTRTAEFDDRRLKWEAMQEQQKKGRQLDSLKELQATLENMEPGMAKEQLTILQKKGELADVVAILRAMDANKQKKILAEYTKFEDTETLAEILREIRKGPGANADAPTKTP